MGRYDDDSFYNFFFLKKMEDTRLYGNIHLPMTFEGVYSKKDFTFKIQVSNHINDSKQFFTIRGPYAFLQRRERRDKAIVNEGCSTHD